jgi:hypothetical protein
LLDVLKAILIWNNTFWIFKAFALWEFRMEDESRGDGEISLREKTEQQASKLFNNAVTPKKKGGVGVNRDIMYQ